MTRYETLDEKDGRSRIVCLGRVEVGRDEEVSRAAPDPETFQRCGRSWREDRRGKITGISGTGEDIGLTTCWRCSDSDEIYTAAS